MGKQLNVHSPSSEGLEVSPYSPTYRYDASDMTSPEPGRDLVMKVGLVVSRPGVGPRTGGRYMGIPRAIGHLHTRFFRPYDDVEMTLPNTDLHLWTTPFETAAFRAGQVDNLAAREGWHWMRWTIADHVAYDLQRDASSPSSITPIREKTHEDPLVIIPCGASKAPYARPAGNLYTGGYHRMTQRAAKALTTNANIRIISALHGLLNLEQVIDPYELRLGQPGSVTADCLIAQADTQGLLSHPDVVILGGRNYSRIAQFVWPDARTPLAGTRGIGEQQHRLARIAAGESPESVSV